MSYLLPIVSFAFVMSITPGPNNLMLWTSGVNYGVRRTLPHMLGINFGFGSLVLLCGLGLGAIFETFPLFQTFLKGAGSLYLLYLAYRIATASFSSDAQVAKPFSFWEAAGFQYANPKAWVMAITVMSAFATPQLSFVTRALLITLVVMLINLPCISAWALFGTAIGRFLRHPKVLISFNILMAGLLVGTIFLLL